MQLINISEIAFCCRYLINTLLHVFALYQVLVSCPDVAISALVLRTRADIATLGHDTGCDTEQDM